jgi:3'-phosphoadenosine 5'-phosphosulfate sulfotransferase (PAPS reductase)/FAD synthetase
MTAPDPAHHHCVDVQIHDRAHTGPQYLDVELMLAFRRGPAPPHTDERPDLLIEYAVIAVTGLVGRQPEGGVTVSDPERILGWDVIPIRDVAGHEVFPEQRKTAARGGQLAPVTPLTPPKPGETAETLSVRFRTVGDITCTCPVESTASTLIEIIAETATTRITERGATRMDDQTSEASMELRKKEGYF